MSQIELQPIMSQIELAGSILTLTFGVGFLGFTMGVITNLFKSNTDNKNNKHVAELYTRKQDLRKLIDTEYHRNRNDYDPRMHYINYLEKQLKEVSEELQSLEERQYKLSTGIIKCNICQTTSKCIKNDDNTKPVCVNCIHDILLECHAKTTWISDLNVQETQNTTRR
jgi:hypothetical protein